MIAIIKAVLIGFLGDCNLIVKSKQKLTFIPFDKLGYVIIAWFVDPVTLPENNNLIKTEGITSCQDELNALEKFNPFSYTKALT